MSRDEDKANELLKQAEAKAKTKAGFFSKIMNSGSNDKEEAAEKFATAGNYFKMAKLWSNAAKAYMRAGDMHMELGVKHEAASKYADASNCYRQSDQKEAIKCLFQTIDIYTEMGKFTIAAKYHTTAGEIYEEMSEIENSSEQYQKAADYYSAEQSTSSANKCLLKVADFAMDLKQFDKAIDIYEQIGRKNMENKLLQYSAKDYFYKAVLCMLSLDIINGSKGLTKYKDLYPMFADSRECKLLEKIVSSIENENVDDFSLAIREHDSISRIEPKIITVLTRIKKMNFRETSAAGPDGEDEGIN